MAKGQRNLFYIFFLFVFGAAPFAYQLEPETQGKHEIGTHERHVKLEGQANFRDLGGYKTSDGRNVKWGLIYRAGQLSKLSDADLSKLEELKIRTVVDLRGPSEVETQGKDRLPKGIRNVSYPIDLASMSKESKQESAPAGSSAAPPDFLLQATRSIIVNRTDVYAALIRELSVPQNRPIVFHCTRGKDRAGVGSAIVLTLLGVPWGTVREDYLLSNIYPKDEIDKELKNIRAGIAQKKGISPEQVDMAGFEPMYYVKPEYIDAAYQEVIKRYGSMDAFFRNGLGISDELIGRLRNELLE